jgi:hypothetical protein
MPKIDVTTNTKIDHLDKTINFLTWGLLAIVIGLIFALGAIWNDYLAMKQASYENLKNSILEQNFILKEQGKDLEETKKYLDTLCKTWRRDCPKP